MKTYVKGPSKKNIDKNKSLLEDFRDTFDNISDTLSEDAKEEKKAKIVKKEMDKDRKSFTKYLPLYEMITQTGEYGPDGNKSVNIPKRNKKVMGGILQNDNERLGYEHGGPHTDTRTEDERQMDYLESAYERAIETGQKEDAQNVADQIDKLQTKMIEEKEEKNNKVRTEQPQNEDIKMLKAVT